MSEPELNTSVSESLKACPLCNGEAWIHRSSHRGGESCIMCIKCSDCGLESDCKDTDEATVAAWNARPEVDDVVEQIARYVEKRIERRHSVGFTEEDADRVVADIREHKWKGGK